MSRNNTWQNLALLQNLLGVNANEYADTQGDVLAKELELRYGKNKSIRDFAKQQTALKNDMGLGAADISMHYMENPKPVMFPTGVKESSGTFDPSSGVLSVLPLKKLGDEVNAHELAHAADFLESGYMPPTNDPASPEYDMHHKYYRNFNEEFPRQLEAQRIIEAGGKPDPKEMKAAPWLEQVRPYSSNKLASPWQFDQPEEDPMWLKNAMFQSERAYGPN